MTRRFFPSRHRDKEPRAGEIYFEFTPIGPQVKVAAIDAATGTEVVVMGPSKATQADLEALAVRKLQRRLASGTR